MKQKEACHELLVALRQDLLLKQPFIGAIALRLEFVPVHDSRLDIASTDGTRIFVHAGRFKKFTKAEALFVVAHEVWHVVLLHFLRRGGRDAERFNYAADLEIHFVLEKEKFDEPFILPHDKGWSGLSAEEIYERLSNPDNYLWAGKSSKNLGGDDSGTNTSGFDSHISSDGLGEGSEDTPNEVSGAPRGGQSTDREDESAKSARSKCKLQEMILDPDYRPSVENGVADRVRGAVNAAAHQVYRVQGDIPGHIKTILDGYLKAEISWKELLARYVTECYSGSRRWLPPSRRHVWRGLYLPSFRTEWMRAVVALDTSGSMVADIELFLSEFAGLLNTFGRYEITLIQCDAEIQKVETFTSDNELPPVYQWEIGGYGGTDFRPPFKYVDEHPELEPSIFIYCTDGAGTEPHEAPNYPVMWVLTPDAVDPAPWGMKLQLGSLHDCY